MKKTHITELLETLRSGEYTPSKCILDTALEMAENELKGANMREQDTLNAAAARIEELSMISKQVVLNLRDGAPSAYAQVYWLRREMSRVVATLGAGTPLDLRGIDDRMEKMK